MDEVVVELTSSFVMADLGIAHEPRAEHAAYIASWLKALKGIRVRSSPPPVRPWPQPTGCTPSALSAPIGGIAEDHSPAADVGYGAGMSGR
jgi:Zincin-like metallopeptidase